MASPPQGNAIPLSPGDRVRVLVPDGELFSGVFEVNLDGTMQIPYLDDITAQGLEITELKQKIYNSLINQKYFKPKFLQVTVSILQWAPVQVTVSGATFQPGLTLINNRTAEERALQQNQSSGDYPRERFLTAALRNAGGITPNANVQKISLIRNGQETIVDLLGVFTGENVEDIPLVAGDRIIVPELPNPNNELVRPSQITPPGVRVFLSNLTSPANSNAGAAIKSDGASFSYGARFSQAVVSANCSGGVATASARRALLVRTNRITGVTQHWDRPVEDLMRNPNNDSENPFLMEADGVACYDSTVSDVRDIFRTITDFINPFNLIFGNRR